MHGERPGVPVKLLSLAFLTLIACASIQHPQSERRHFITTPIVENALDFLYFAIAERAGLEAWFCLRGFVDWRTENVMVQNITPVFVDSADGENIHGRPAECRRGQDSAQIIGTVHFHPSMNQCEFSDVDFVTAHYLPYSVTAIMCKDTLNPRPHLVMAFRSEIDSAFRANKKKSGGSNPETRTFKPLYVYRPR